MLIVMDCLSIAKRSHMSLSDTCLKDMTVENVVEDKTQLVDFGMNLDNKSLSSSFSAILITSSSYPLILPYLQ